MKTITRYACEVCGRVFDDTASAAKCEARGERKPTIAVGDIVTGGRGFGWYDGDRAWIANADKVDPKKKGHADEPRRRPFEFIYVVTAITPDEHDGHFSCFHLATLAMTGDSGYRSGYTTDSGHHFGITKVARPPVGIVEASKALIGTLATSLL